MEQHPGLNLLARSALGRLPPGQPRHDRSRQLLGQTGCPVDVTFKSGANLVSATDAFTKIPIKPASPNVLSVEVPSLDFRLIQVELKP